MVSFASSLLVIVIMMLMSAATTQLTTDINCTQLEFLNVHDDIIHTTVGRHIKVTFSLRFENCSTNDGLLVKIAKKTKGNLLPTIECNIFYNLNTCTVSNSSLACECTSPTAATTFTTRLREAGNYTYVWTWRYNTSGDNERTITVVVSGDDSMNFSFNMIILGSIVGSLVVITVTSVMCLVLYQKRETLKTIVNYQQIERNARSPYYTYKVKETFELSPQAPKWSGDARNPCGQGQGLVSKKQHSMGQYTDVHDSLFKPEKNVYNSRSRPRRDTSRHNMSQDTADLIRQSAGSIYGQVYDALMLQTATAATSHQSRPSNRS